MGDRAEGEPPPYGAGAVFRERTWLQRLEGQLRPKALWDMRRFVLGIPEYSVFDLPRIVRGFRFSLDAMWERVSRVNLLTLVPALQVPVFFFLGRHDHWVPPDTSVAYFEMLAAPSKTLKWFEASGHEPFVDEPDRFNALMVELVRPVAGADGERPGGQSGR
ncbi:MAG: alpha/beta hydrolase [Acidobacteriota bacterium]|nr:alpha/beta hydrolase [Acidobacteriota bacterium]